MRAEDVAEYIVVYFQTKGELLTNKKLQKLLYYIEAWFLADKNKSLISEDFEAWVFGPVVSSVYREYKQFKYNPIRFDYDSSAESKLKGIIKENKISKDDVNFLNLVLTKYGCLSAFELEFLSHSETPWLEARGNLSPVESCNTVISKNTMKEYYKNL